MEVCDKVSGWMRFESAFVFAAAALNLKRDGARCVSNAVRDAAPSRCWTRTSTKDSASILLMAACAHKRHGRAGRSSQSRIVRFEFPRPEGFGGGARGASADFDGIEEGFINCARCGADLPVELRRFERGKKTLKVRCAQCGDRFDAVLERVDVFHHGDIVKATSILSRSAPSAVAGSASTQGAGVVVKLFVGGLPPRVTEERLKSAFSEVALVEKAAIVKDRVTDRSRGFGFVEVLGDKNAQAIIDAFNGSSVFGGGRGISVKIAEE